MIFPIVEREMLAATRKPRTHWSRVIVAAVACATVSWILLTGVDLSPQRVGPMLFNVLAQLGFYTCLLPGVLLTADCISQEKREGTLGLLFLTDLKGSDIVFGKLVATSAHAFYALLAIFPVMAIPLLAGGVTLGEVGRMVVVLINTLFFSLAAGMLVSAFSRWEKRAMMGAAILIFMGVFGVEIPGPPFHLLSLRTGMRGAFDVAFTANPALFYGSTIWIFVLSWSLLGWACWLVPRRVEEKIEPQIASDEATYLLPKAEEITGEVAQSTGMEKLGEGNPVEWLANRDGQTSVWMWLTIIFSGLAWMMAHPFLNSGKGSAEFAVAAGLLFHAFLKFWLAYDAASRFTADRRCGALEMLLSTPLTVSEMLGGQFRAMIKRFFKPLLCVLALDLALFMTGFGTARSIPGGWTLLLIQFVVVGTFLMDVAAVAMFGMWQGLRTRQSGRAALWTAGRVLALPTALFSVVVFLVLLTGEMRRLADPKPLVLLWFIISVTNAALCISAALRHLREDFRELAAQHASGAPLAPAAAGAR
jgi:ABC-type transport system involved in multi-copper enzyme maturation permease subunit